MSKKELTTPAAETVNTGLVDTVDALVAKMNEVREAQRIFATYTQEQVDKIFFAAAMAANQQRLPLAKMAVEETGMGIVEDKVIKNHYAAEYIYNAYKDVKTCGVVEEDAAYGVKKIAEGCKLGLCTGCFTGEYPAEVPSAPHKSKFEKKISESAD